MAGRHCPMRNTGQLPPSLHAWPACTYPLPCVGVKVNHVCQSQPHVCRVNTYQRSHCMPTTKTVCCKACRLRANVLACWLSVQLLASHSLLPKRLTKKPNLGAWAALPPPLKHRTNSDTNPTQVWWQIGIPPGHHTIQSIPCQR